LLDVFAPAWDDGIDKSAFTAFALLLLVTDKLIKFSTRKRGYGCLKLRLPWQKRVPEREQSGSISASGRPAEALARTFHKLL
jgi:hypothetical protein